MDYKKLSAGLGWFSLALGATELIAGRRIAKALDADGSENVVRAFGAREVAAGAAILQSPAHSARVWGRVAGDALDLGALALAARKAPRNAAVWGSIGFVIGAAIIDAIVARGLGASPDAEEAKDPQSKHATSAEPLRTAKAMAPAVA